MAQKNIQFDLCFDSDNRLGASLLQGEFIYIVELDTPDDSIQAAQAVALIKEQTVEITSLPWVFALSVNDRSPYAAGLGATDFLDAVTENTHKATIFCISGKMSSENEIRGCLAHIRSRGCRNVMAVSGDWVDGLAGHYTDSVDIISTACMFESSFNLGGVVNPFKYTVMDQYLQFTKMLRKYNSGARYFVSQSGWDMKKAQEMQWFLQMREVNVPVFARMMIVTPENSGLLSDGCIRPGCFWPVPICDILLRNLNRSSEEFMDRQLKFLALQAVGYQKLGFSGIQVAGCRDVKVLRDFYQEVQNLEAECPDYNSWLACWNQEFGGYNLSLKSNPAYLFNNLLLENGRDPDFNEHPMVGTALGKPSALERLCAYFTRCAAEGHGSEFFKNAIGKLLAISEDEWKNLLETEFFKNDGCPKRLLKGACGNCFPDGSCEADREAECFFHKVLKMAAYRNTLDAHETGKLPFEIQEKIENV